ncbi:MULTISPECIES: siphovirus Gp157 family protein [Fischerella]|uniref:siphovirus Gp157 family protein n=1 Tax=Fischerella TaxID=1190 RepID=UPI0002FBD1FC|nr:MULTISPECIES: siphovirus Gp157 family protein [Fischerella]MBD2432380.1 siphovirus Gp157 family protein [Fischerella sp. FACHB-380]
MTQAIEREINQLTLKELSLDAAKLWSQIEEVSELGEEGKVEQLVQELMGVQNGIETKIDAIAWVVDQLNLDLETWEERKARVAELHDQVISRRKTQLEQIKRTLIHLHEIGLISDKNIGKERVIEIRDNPPKVANLLVEVDDEDFPAEFRVIKYQANNKAILEAYKSGQDISDIAEITIGKQVRFKVQSATKGRNKKNHN